MTARQPIPRHSHAVAGIGSKLYVWGGNSFHPIRTRSLEVFDVPAVTWNKPQDLYGSVIPDLWSGMAVTTDGERAYCCGGRAGDRHSDQAGDYTTVYTNTLFQVTPSQHQCEVLQPTSPPHKAPEGRSSSCIVHFKDKLVLHGGHGVTDPLHRFPIHSLNELHVFDLRNREHEI